jgi:ABC-type taurine transport system ATPase subunit
MADLITAHARIHNTAVLMSLHDVPMAQARADRLMVLSGRPARLVLHRSNHTATKMSHFNQS